MEPDPEARTKQTIEGYLKDLRWPYEWDNLHDVFSVTCKDGDDTLDIRVSWNKYFLVIGCSRLVMVPKKAKVAALQRMMSLHWDTVLPKFEWDKSDGEVRARAYLPIGEGLPDKEQFLQFMRVFGPAAIKARQALKEVIEKSKGGLSGDPGDRIPDAADLDNLGRDLVDLAAKREILPMYVRDDLVEKLVSALGGPRQQILLVGESGTGKNAVVHSLATWIAQEDARIDRGRLKGRHIYECVPASFQASVMYAHELENKTQMIAENCIEQNAILFIDEMQLAVTTGRFDEKLDRTIANLLLPFISRNEITLIGATDPEGYKTMLKLNARFAQSFHVIEIPEPPIEEATLMVQDRIDKFASGDVTGAACSFEPGVNTRLVELSGRFMRTRRYPGKALELLNEVIALQSENRQTGAVTAADVERAMCRLSGLRPEIVRSDAPVMRDEVEDALRAEVMGQEEAVRRVADVVLAYKAELTPPDRPIATMFFAGPTGVGKTQLARTLAKYLFGTDEALLRYDMSEFADNSGFTKLCGRKGHTDEPGRLVEDVSAKPFSIILFDEIEKAHDSVFNVLLQVLGEGRMTDETGRTASFLNSVIIMTSNVGAELFGQSQLGFSKGAAKEVSADDLRKKLEERFRPEFLNRISHLVCFQPLSMDTVREVAKREVQALAQRTGLQRRKVTLQVSPALLDQLALSGYDKRYGARSMQRTVETLVTMPLSERLAARADLMAMEMLLDWDGSGVVMEEL